MSTPSGTKMVRAGVTPVMRRRVLAVFTAIALALVLVFVGPLGGLRAQGDLNWSWTSGQAWLGVGSASHVSLGAHNASSSPQQVRITIRQAQSPFDLVYQETTTMAAGRGGQASVDCGPIDPSCGFSVTLTIETSSPQVAPHGWIDASGGMDPEAIQRLHPGDFMLVSPRNGTAAATIAGLERTESLGGGLAVLDDEVRALGGRVESLQGELRSTRQRLRRQARNSQRKIVRRLKRIQRAVR
jgi:hypothetical protein